MSPDGWLKALARDLLGMFVPTSQMSPEEARLAAARAAVRETLSERNAALERCTATRERAEAQVRELERDAPGTSGAGREQRLATARAGLREAARAERAARAARDAALEAGRTALAAGEAPAAVTTSAADDGSWEAMSARLVEAGSWFAPDERGAALVARAISQASALAEQHARFLEVLARKLDPTELTYGRYADAAQQVIEGVHGNLGHAGASLATLRDVDEVSVRRAIEQLETRGAGGTARSDELDALRRRLALAVAEADRADALLAANETAATTLIEATAALGALPDLGTGAAPQTRLALAELESLARRAVEYR